MDPKFKAVAESQFVKYDINKSNFIELGELNSLMKDTAKEIGIPPPDDDEIQETLKEFDENKDKKISLEEFLNLFNVLYQMKKSKSN
jgi:Ca2+-binding EF-hand superfamily protein